MVYIFDTDELWAKRVGNQLIQNGFSVISSSDVDQAMTDIIRLDVQAVITEVHLNGDPELPISLISRLKSHERTRDIPIYVASEVLNPEIRRSLDKIVDGSFRKSESTTIPFLVGRVRCKRAKRLHAARVNQS